MKIEFSVCFAVSGYRGSVHPERGECHCQAPSPGRNYTQYLSITTLRNYTQYFVYPLARCVLRQQLLDAILAYKRFPRNVLFSDSRENGTSSCRCVKTSKVMEKDSTVARGARCAGWRDAEKRREWRRIQGSSLRITFIFTTPKKPDNIHPVTSDSTKMQTQKSYSPSPFHLDYLLPESCGQGFCKWHSLWGKKHSEAQAWVKTMLTSSYSGVVFTGLSHCIWKLSNFRRRGQGCLKLPIPEKHPFTFE